MTHVGATRHLDIAQKNRQRVGMWLLTLAMMVLVMVCLGGVTRLTGSGLSMVDWQPFTVLPPLSKDAWLAVFAKYQATPQYRLMNNGMTLDAFKDIFWLEYLHRLWGRLIGLAFLLPFAVFFATGRIARADASRLVLIFILGGAQGALGWFMVASGLSERPEVSHYRLAAHLLAALAIFAALLWSALNKLDFYPQAIGDDTGASSLSSSPGLTRQSMDPRVKPGDDVNEKRTQPCDDGTVSIDVGRLWRPVGILLGLVILTMAAGALVAGLHAGLIYNSFPLMNGAWLPGEAFDQQPTWINFFENHALVQFDHRMLASVVWVGTLALWVWSRQLSLPPALRRRLALLPLAATLQAGFGIATLLAGVPVGLAAVHQACAFLLFSALLWALHGIKAPSRSANR